jgi:hypothetical protein
LREDDKIKLRLLIAVCLLNRVAANDRKEKWNRELLLWFLELGQDGKDQVEGLINLLSDLVEKQTASIFDMHR